MNNIRTFQSNHIVLTGNTVFKLANFRSGLIKSLIEDGHKVTIIAPEDDLKGEVLSMGCNFLPIAMSRKGKSPLSEIMTLLGFIKTLNNLKPDIVFSYTIKNNIYCGLACRLLGINFYPNVTGMGPAFGGKDLLSLILSKMYLIAFKKAGKIFFQNDIDLKTFVDLGICKIQQASLLPGSGVDLNSFRFREMPMEQDGIEILFLSRMIRDKGAELFAEAAGRVSKLRPNSKFTMIGPLEESGPDSVSIDEIKNWERNFGVTYLGAEKNVYKCIVKSSCVVLPTWYREGTPRTLLEAGACGRPIITTNTPGCRDVVIDGYNGFCIPPKNLDALVDAIVRFIDLSEFEKSLMGIRSRDNVEQRYDENIVINAYKTLLRQN